MQRQRSNESLGEQDMAMTSSSDRGGLSSSINVTPLIDVLLVLLIIFMVIVPVVPKGLGAVLPKPPMDDHNSAGNIVVSVLRTQGRQLEYKINQEIVQKGDLSNRLNAIYALRAERTMFVKGDDDINFVQIAEVIDMGHSAGVDRVALLTPKVAEGL
jgi:biopolymer transport protein TolR